MNVNNKQNAEIQVCKCGSWLKHWRNYSWSSTDICLAEGCERKDIMGAIVKKDIRYDNRSYVVPFCPKHSTAKGSILLKHLTVLIPAKPGPKCGK